MPVRASFTPSTTSYALLGLLSLRPWTTYELAKQVRRSLNWFWPRAERRLYDEPKALVAAGLATSRKQYTGQRAGTVYEITDAGRGALRDWLDRPPGAPSGEFEAMIKVFFADAGSVQQLQETLRAVERGAVQRIDELVGMAQQTLAGNAQFRDRAHISALALRLQLGQEMAVLDWGRWAGAQVAAWRSTTDAGDWEHRRVLAELVEVARERLATGDADACLR